MAKQDDWFVFLYPTKLSKVNNDQGYKKYNKQQYTYERITSLFISISLYQSFRLHPLK